MYTIPFRIKTAIGGKLLLVLASLPAHAQLPAPSRTIYKCAVAGKIAYTDVPCLGAKRLDVVPARGVDKLSGTSRVGATVAREYQQEGMARALKPLLGMNEQQYAQQCDVKRWMLEHSANAAHSKRRSSTTNASSSSGPRAIQGRRWRMTPSTCVSVITSCAARGLSVLAS